MEVYKRKVYYYETDKMGIVHHSNYIRMLEEARIDFLEKTGKAFDVIEKMGYMSPVISVGCEYKYPLRFSDEFRVETKLSFFDAVKYGFSYKIIKTDGDVLCATGESVHCFTDNEGNVVSLWRSDRKLFEHLSAFAERD